jgi:hypothetical protein
MSCTLNGTNVAGTFGSANDPGRLTGANALSNTWMCGCRLHRGESRRVDREPGVDGAVVVTLIVEFRPPAQPEIVPFRLAKRNLEDVVVLPGVNWNDAVLVLLDRLDPAAAARWSECRRTRSRSRREPR